MRAAQREVIHAAIVRRWKAGERSLPVIAELTGTSDGTVAAVLEKAGLRERPPPRSGGRKPRRTLSNAINAAREKR